MLNKGIMYRYIGYIIENLDIKMEDYNTIKDLLIKEQEKFKQKDIIKQPYILLPLE